MAVNRQFSWLGQQRVDIPHLRSLESAVCYDFDALAYNITNNSPYITKGFQLNATVNQPANQCTVTVAGSLIAHPLATESGSFLAVPTNRLPETLDPSISTKVSGSMQPNATNYIGIDFTRFADPTTADVEQFLNPSTNLESSQNLPLARTLDYIIIISQSDFTYNRSVAPVAIVATNSLNQVLSYQDARPLLGRLNPGGSNSSPITPYGWPGGRTETLTSNVAGDKSLTSLKTWMNATMTRLWELGGGEQWYSPTADRNVNLHTGNTVFSSTGESFEVVSSNLLWQGLSFSFDNSTQAYVTINDQTTSLAGLTDLADGDCIYADLDRTSGSSVQPQKGHLTTLGLPIKPGSRWVIATRIGSNYYVSGQPWPIGSAFSLATTVHAGVLKTNLDVSSINPIAATVIPTIGSMLGVVVAAGISHATTAGTTIASGSNDIQIGLGTANGDNNNLIRTGGNYGNVIQGSGTSIPFLKIQAGDSTSLSPVSTNVGQTPLNICDLTKFEGSGVWSLNTVFLALPLSPNSGATGAAQIKYFTKQTKTWREPVDVVTLSSANFTYNSGAMTLTYSSSIALSLDDYPLSTNMRVLVAQPGALYNGIYVVTYPGGGSPCILTRTIDAGGPGSLSALGVAWDVFDGCAVKVTSGESYGNTYWVLSCPAVNSYTTTTGLQPWVQTDNQTSDQFCVMFWDGSYTALTTGPAYGVS